MVVGYVHIQTLFVMKCTFATINTIIYTFGLTMGSMLDYNSILKTISTIFLLSGIFYIVQKYNFVKFGFSKNG